MRVRLKAFTTIFLICLAGAAFFSTTPASAAINSVILIDSPHRDLLGIPLNNELAVSLLPNGRLGKLVFNPVPQPRRWMIDAELIEEITAVAQSDPIAKDWLTEFKLISSTDPIFALPYGHPDISMTKRLAPTELSYYYSSSQAKLAAALGREIGVNRGFRWTSHKTFFPPDTTFSYTSNRRAIVQLSTVVPAELLDSLRSKLGILLATEMTPELQHYFASNANQAIALTKRNLRIVAGKYRLTSQHEKIPITLVNDFASPVTVSLQLTPLNSRIYAVGDKHLTLPANSKTQLSVPFTVIAPGSTAVLAEFKNVDGKTVGDSAILTLNLSVISPAVAWFTSGAAILLLLAALAQIIRRVRRSRK